MNGGNRFGNAVGAMRENKWIVAVTVMLPTLIEIIDISVANVSLDHIRGSLSAGIDEAGWVLTSYLVSNAIIIPMTGWFARSFGRKRYLLFSIFLFTAASFLCGSSTSLGMLVFFRVLQGIGGGALQPLSRRKSTGSPWPSSASGSCSGRSWVPSWAATSRIPCPGDGSSTSTSRSGCSPSSW